jgi:hypothetical protein
VRESGVPLKLNVLSDSPRKTPAPHRLQVEVHTLDHSAQSNACFVPCPVGDRKIRSACFPSMAVPEHLFSPNGY